MSDKPDNLIELNTYRDSASGGRVRAVMLSNHASGLHHQGNFEAAIATYRQAIIVDPKFAIAYSNLGSVLSKLGRNVEAVAVLEQAIRLNPNDAFAHSNLGFGLLRLGRSEEAIASCKKAIELDPKFVEPYTILAGVYSGTRRTKEAKDTYGIIVGLRPDDAEAKAYYDLLCKTDEVMQKAAAAKQQRNDPQPRTAARRGRRAKLADAKPA